MVTTFHLFLFLAIGTEFLFLSVIHDLRQLFGKIFISMHSVLTLFAQKHGSVHGFGQG